MLKLRAEKLKVVDYMTNEKLIYFIFVNALAIVLVLYDKFASKRSMYRIPEKTLFLVAIGGGAICMYISMQLIRHKTRHKSFMVGLPLIIIGQALIYFKLILFLGLFYPRIFYFPKSLTKTIYGSILALSVW